MGIQWESNGNPKGIQRESNGNPMETSIYKGKFFKIPLEFLNE